MILGMTGRHISANMPVIVRRNAWAVIKWLTPSGLRVIELRLSGADKIRSYSTERLGRCAADGALPGGLAPTHLRSGVQRIRLWWSAAIGH